MGFRCIDLFEFGRKQKYGFGKIKNHGNGVDEGSEIDDREGDIDRDEEEYNEDLSGSNGPFLGQINDNYKDENRGRESKNAFLPNYLRKNKIIVQDDVWNCLLQNIDQKRENENTEINSSKKRSFNDSLTPPQDDFMFQPHAKNLAKKENIPSFRHNNSVNLSEKTSSEVEEKMKNMNNFNNMRGMECSQGGREKVLVDVNDEKNDQIYDDNNNENVNSNNNTTIYNNKLNDDNNANISNHTEEIKLRIFPELQTLLLKRYSIPHTTSATQTETHTYIHPQIMTEKITENEKIKITENQNISIAEKEKKKGPLFGGVGIIGGKENQPGGNLPQHMKAGLGCEIIPSFVAMKIIRFDAQKLGLIFSKVHFLLFIFLFTLLSLF